LSLKDSSLFVLKGWKNKRKLHIWDIAFDFHFKIILVIFPSIFFEFLISKLFVFHT